MNIWNAGLIFCARLRCLNCARKSMTNIASLGEMHRTLVSFVRRDVCTQKLVLKIERDSFAVCNMEKQMKKQQFADCTPVFYVHCFAIYRKMG